MTSECEWTRVGCNIDFTFSDHGLPLRTSSPWSTDSPTVSIGIPAEMRERFCKQFHGWCSNDCKLFPDQKTSGKGSKRKSRNQVQAKIFYFSVHFCAYGECERVKSSLSTGGTMSPPLYMCRKRETVWIKSDGERERASKSGRGQSPSKPLLPLGHALPVWAGFLESSEWCVCVCAVVTPQNAVLQLC